MGMRFDEIGELLERTDKSVKSRWKLLGLARDRRFTPEQIAQAKAMHGQATAAEIAASIGRSTSGVHQLFRRLGLPLLTRRMDRPAVEAWIKARHAEQWSDGEIAAGWTREHPDDPLDRRYCSELRTALGLASWGMTTQRLRRRVAAKTREQLAKAGLPSLAAVRVKAFEDYAAARLVQILNLLYERGPHSREQIAKSLHLTWSDSPRHPASRRGLSGNGPGGSYIAELMRLGLVVRLGRNVRTGPGRGQRVNLYAVAPHVQRKTAG